MLITHGISNYGILDADELALLFGAFDAACSQIPDNSLDAEIIAKEIVAAYGRGVTDEWELAELATTSTMSRVVNLQ